MATFFKRTHIPVPADVAFAWHARSGALGRLLPPWENVRVLSRSGTIRDGDRVVFRMQVGPFSQKWVAEHRNFQPGRSFQDVQIDGPFANWEHTHRVSADGPKACWLEDQIEYELPFGSAGRILGGSSISRQLQRMFAYRHRVTHDDLVAHAQYGSTRTMKIAVTGSSGLIGSALVDFLTAGGHDVLRVVRSMPRHPEREMQWDPDNGMIESKRLEGCDAVVHLAGENIGAGRWTAKKKARIRESRIGGTSTLCEALAQLDAPPKTLVSASAIGYYGDRGEQQLDESQAPGSGFLPDVCRQWEAATEPAEQKGIRVVHSRTGVVLSPAGGALAKMLLPFKLGGGGVIGSGRQYWSWIALDDVVGAIHHALIHDELNGPVNVVAPNPATNREFTKTLGKVLGRPTIVPMPAAMARLALGEMADELLLASARVIPAKLQQTGYSFRFSQLEDALRHVLGKAQ